MRLRARHFDTGKLVDVVCEAGVVSKITPSTNLPADREAEWIAPGFFDLQVNGAGGTSFNSEQLTVDDVCRAVRMIASHGVTGQLPTLVTNSQQAMVHALDILRRALSEDKWVAARVPGFHLEGPWISAEVGYRGAHPKQHVRLPNWDDFQSLQDAAGGLIKLVTLSPELPGCLEFIEKLNKSGVKVGLGHTAAEEATIESACQAGAQLATHIGNGLPEMIHRHRNPMWPQLACERLMASVIMDGHHIPDAVFRTIVLTKRQERVVLISDASSLAGLPPGRYRDWDHDLEISEDGRVILAGTPYLAGSAMFLDECVGRAAQSLRSPRGLALAIQMASLQSRQFLGLGQPNVVVGSPVEFVLFDELPTKNILVRHVVT